MTFQPEVGMKLLAQGDIDVYEVRGSYQLVVTALRPDGIGELHIALEKLKKKLSAQGLFDTEHKKALPQFPRRVGVATSPTGAVLHDIINVTRRRFPVDILLSPTVVQGDNAVESIVNSIKCLNSMDIDVIILARGGGSLEDLWPFNSEQVAGAIYDSRIPVVSAIGHETDFTVADLTADIRAPTPSSAAELVVPDRNEVMVRVDTARSHLISSITGLVSHHNNHLLHLENQVDARRLVGTLNQHFQRVDELGTRLALTMDRELELQNKHLESCVGKLNAVSPLNTLKRGYTIVMHEGRVVRSVEDTKKGDALEMRVTDGKIYCKVTDTEDKI